jgi:hypothetical protein
MIMIATFSEKYSRLALVTSITKKDSQFSRFLEELALAQPPSSRANANHVRENAFAQWFLDGDLLKTLLHGNTPGIVYGCPFPARVTADSSKWPDYRVERNALCRA